MTARTLEPLSIDLNGMQLIEASAGTGKTYTITTLFLRLLLETPMDISRILVVTFTEAAAAELKARIRQRIIAVLKDVQSGDMTDPLTAHLFGTDARNREKRLVTALCEFDTAAIATIHSFLKQVLTEHAFECGVSFDSELVTDQNALFDEVVHDFFAKETAAASPHFLTYLETRKHGPTQLRDLLDKAVRVRGAAVLPEARNVDDPGPGFDAAFGSARAEWQRSGDDFEFFLEEHKGINRRVYSKRHLPRWLDALRDYLSNAAPRPPLPDAIRRFTREALSPSDDAPPIRHPMVDAVDALVRAADAFDTAFVAMKRRFLDEAFDALERVKHETEVHTFDDLIRLVDESLGRGDPLRRAIRERLDAVLIDEFQDTDPVQYRIFNTLFADGAPFILIGDPKQSIYGFRGADIFTYLAASRTASDRRTTLPTNWRSDPGLIRAVNTLFASAPRPFFFDDIAFAPVDARADIADRFETTHRNAPLEIRFVERPQIGDRSPIPSSIANVSLPKRVARDIAALLRDIDGNGTSIRPSELAVLVSTNRQAETLLHALESLGIQGVLFGARSVFQSPEAEEMLTVMTAIDDPGHLGKLTAALATRIVGLDAPAIGELDGQPGRLERWVGRLTRLRRSWDERGFIQMWNLLLDDDTLSSTGATLGAAILTRSEGERTMTNLRHLAELIERHRTAALFGRRALLHFLAERIGDTRTLPEEAEMRLESDTERVRIITVHKSKGLEFDVVYCPFLFDGLGATTASTLFFHHPLKDRRPYLDLGSDALETHRAYAVEEEIAEKLRLAYVALTRARHKTIVVHGAFSGMESSPLAYLLHHGNERHTLASLKHRVKALSDDDLLADIDALIGQTGGTIHRTALLDEDIPVGLAPAASSAPRLGCRVSETPLLPSVTTTSFTHLVRSEVGVETEALSDAFDEIDPVDLGAPVSTPSRRPQAISPRSPDPVTAPPQPQLAFDFSLQTAAAPSEDTPLPIIDLERGARAGTMLHAIFEVIDFMNIDRKIIDDALDLYGFEPAWRRPILEMLTAVLSAPLDTETGLRLERVPVHKRQNELPFLFPVAHEKTLSRGFFDALGALLTASGTPVPEGYDAALAALSPSITAGYLKGFIDLVFEHGGRYYIVDYKSNYLGDRMADYGPKQLRTAMGDHHYYVQYLIYTVALYRYLGHRRPDVRFETVFGGVYYLFLRGMTGTSAAFGVFHDTPPISLVTAVDALLGGKTGGPL